MSEYECPDCRGGFPDPDGGRCPWCGTAIDGEFERDGIEELRTVVDEDGDGEQRSPLEQILGFGGGGSR